MYSFFIFLCLHQQPQDLHDSVYKYKRLWLQSSDSILNLSRQIHTNKSQFRKIKTLIDECMDRNCYYFNKYFEYKAKLDAEDDLKKHTI